MIVQFYNFEFDLILKELRKSGIRLKLDPQAAELLEVLLEAPGRLVAREDIRKRLWPDGTNVEFDRGINRCINQIRRALGDDARHPIYIEMRKTVGYRFIAPVTQLSTEGPQSGKESVLGHSGSSVPSTPLLLDLPIRSFVVRHKQHLIISLILAILGVEMVRAMLASAYWLAIGLVGLFVLFAVLLATMGEIKTAVSRAVLSTLSIAAMAYIASASTLPYIISTVVNASTLKPAVIYPLVTGLKFIPIYVLVFGFWTLLAGSNDAGFPKNRALGRAYVFLGVGFLLATGIALGGPSGDYRIWHARIPGHWTLTVGYSVIVGINIAVWFAGHRAFNRDVITGYAQLFLFCALGYLPLTITAAIVDQQYNEINRFNLDQRRPIAYVAENPGVVKEIARAAPPALRAKMGEDLFGLLGDARFLRALETQPFYKQDFDEPFQVDDKAVMFGYRETPSRAASASPFRIIRFPLSLAAAIRFRPSNGER